MQAGASGPMPTFGDEDQLGHRAWARPNDRRRRGALDRSQSVKQLGRTRATARPRRALRQHRCGGARERRRGDDAQAAPWGLGAAAAKHRGGFGQQTGEALIGGDGSHSWRRAGSLPRPRQGPGRRHRPVVGGMGHTAAIPNAPGSFRTGEKNPDRNPKQGRRGRAGGRLPRSRNQAAVARPQLGFDSQLPHTNSHMPGEGSTRPPFDRALLALGQSPPARVGGSSKDAARRTQRATRRGGTGRDSAAAASRPRMRFLAPPRSP